MMATIHREFSDPELSLPQTEPDQTGRYGQTPDLWLLPPRRRPRRGCGGNRLIGPRPRGHLLRSRPCRSWKSRSSGIRGHCVSMVAASPPEGKIAGGRPIGAATIVTTGFRSEPVRTPNPGGCAGLDRP